MLSNRKKILDARKVVLRITPAIWGLVLVLLGGGYPDKCWARDAVLTADNRKGAEASASELQLLAFAGNPLCKHQNASAGVDIDRLERECEMRCNAESKGIAKTGSLTNVCTVTQTGRLRIGIDTPLGGISGGMTVEVETTREYTDETSYKWYDKCPPEGCEMGHTELLYTAKCEVCFDYRNIKDFAFHTFGSSAGTVIQKDNKICAASGLEAPTFVKAVCDSSDAEEKAKFWANLWPKENKGGGLKVSAESICSEAEEMLRRHIYAKKGGAVCLRDEDCGPPTFAKEVLRCERIRGSNTCMRKTIEGGTCGSFGTAPCDKGLRCFNNVCISGMGGRRR